MTTTTMEHVASNALAQLGIVKEEDAQALFLKVIASPEVKDKTELAIKTLNQTVRDIRQAFWQITEDIQRFDDKQITNVDGIRIQLRPRWRELYERFNRIISASHDNAIEAAAFMKQYSVTILEDVSESDFPDLKVELQNFLKILEVKDKMAAQTRDDFATLADDVRHFAIDINQFLFKVEDEVAAELEGIEKRMKALKIRLGEIGNRIKDVAKACLLSFATGATAIGFAIFALSPDTIILAVTSTVAAIKSGGELIRLIKEQHRARDELRRLDQSRNDALDQQLAVHEHVRTLTAVNTDSQEIAMKIDTIVNIWQSLKADIHDFKEQLEHSAHPDVKITKFFLRKIAATRVLYQRLAYLLEEYAKGSEGISTENM
ncbi:hypothetical protein C8Q76DRAFT_686128 [Earliella scabrosa]|nr:hypothetical protein C8Q76DRAFT_686128 [Earliella scabrosa]